MEKEEKAAPPATVRGRSLKRRTDIDTGSQTARNFPAGHSPGNAAVRGGWLPEASPRGPAADTASSRNHSVLFRITISLGCTVLCGQWSTSHRCFPFSHHPPSHPATNRRKRGSPQGSDCEDPRLYRARGPRAPDPALGCVLHSLRLTSALRCFQNRNRLPRRSTPSSGGHAQGSADSPPWRPCGSGL